MRYKFITIHDHVEFRETKCTKVSGNVHSSRLQNAEFVFLLPFPPPLTTPGLNDEEEEARKHLFFFFPPTNPFGKKEEGWKEEGGKRVGEGWL